MPPTLEFNLVSDIYGWGDPGSREDPGIWFVGIEEAGDWITDAKCELKKLDQERGASESSEHEIIQKAKVLIQRYYNKSKAGKFVPVSEDEYKKWGRSPVRPYTAKIVCRCSPTIQKEFGDQPYSDNHPAKKIWDSYQRKILWRSGSGVCNANLYPLGKPTTHKDDWPQLYEELFGFGQNDIENYKMEVRTNRFLEMRGWWEHCRHQATICYVGKGYLEDVESLFQLASDEWSPLDEDQAVMCQKGKHILFTSHFSRPPMSDRRAHAIEKQLARWGLTLPK